MRKSIYFFLLPAVITVSVSCSDKFDGKDGVKTVMFPHSDKVHQTVEYKNGMMNGTLKEYYENGNLKTIQHFKDDKNVDSAIYYHPNGKLKGIQIQENGFKAGCWKKFNESGKLYSEMCFTDGKLNGTVKTYSYKSLNLIECFNYKDGSKEGKQEIFYNSGKPKSVTYYYWDLPGLGTEEWLENGDPVNNDFEIHVSEKNKVKLENKLYFYVTLKDPQPDDEVWKIADKNEGNKITQEQKLEKEGDTFKLQFSVYNGGFIMEKVKIAAYRKTRFGNTFIKTYSFNASVNNY